MEIQNSRKRNLSYQISNVWSKVNNIIKISSSVVITDFVGKKDSSLPPYI